MVKPRSSTASENAWISSAKIARSIVGTTSPIVPLPDVPLPPGFREKLGQREIAVNTTLPSGTQSSTDILVAGQEANTVIESFGGLLFDQTTSVSGSPTSTPGCGR